MLSWMQSRPSVFKCVKSLQQKEQTPLQERPQAAGSAFLPGHDPAPPISSLRVCQFQSLRCGFFSLQGSRRFGAVHSHGGSRQEVAAAPAHQQQRVRSVRHDLGLGCRYISQETLIPLDDSGEQQLLLRWFVLPVCKYPNSAVKSMKYMNQTSATAKRLITRRLVLFMSRQQQKANWISTEE